jgi:hypothetical protein
MLSSRTSLALGASCLALLSFSSAALAAGPATVTVRVEGLSATKLPPTQLTTTTEPVVKDGQPEHSCPGTSALGALELATAGNWGGKWEASFGQYAIFSIEGESHVFEPGAPANYFWTVWVNHAESELGACAVEPEAGQEVLFFPSCFGEACPPAPLPLGIQVPAVAEVGELPVTVTRYSASGAGSPAAGATVSYGGASAVTDAVGAAKLKLSVPGEVTLNVSAPESVRTEATICVHKGNDGNCGTTAPAGSGVLGTGSGSGAGGVAGFTSAPYRGPYALVAGVSDVLDGHVYRRGHAPRVLAGTIHSHSAVSLVELQLRRQHRGSCTSYDGTSERFVSARCGQGSFFRASSSAAFSYLLPAALAPGRYVLDIHASDAAGNRTTLARGTSRIVFYVR